jgi:hypothetical protein
MNSLRNLHSIGIDHSHDHLFDVDSFYYHNETDIALPTTTDDDINTAMEIENRNRAISMSIILSVLIFAYLSFCCLYQRKRELQRVSRDQLRNDNRAVLDESTDATSRALRDEEMYRKLEERKKKIRNVLVTRLVVGEDFMGESTQFAVADEGAKVNVQDGLTAGANSKSLDGDTGIAPGVTQSTSEETNAPNTPDNNTSDTNKGSIRNQDTAVSTTTATTNSSTCIDLKKISSSISNCGNSSHYCSTSHNACLDSTHRESFHDQNKVLTDEECNICLSAFQVGDRIAWSRTNKSLNNVIESQGDPVDCVLQKDTACCHIFHAECIERWLLVREGCPVCRRSYFDQELDCSDEMQQLAGGDIEAGEITEAGFGVNSSHARVVVAVEE